MPLDLKSTLNLPKTDFPMKANLPQNEPKMLAHWEKIRIYDQIRAVAAGRAHLRPARRAALRQRPHPPRARAEQVPEGLHREVPKTMAGFDSPYVPGWDCHGLPIEIKVDEALGRKKLEMDPLQVREACRKYAEKYLDLQREQFKRLGVFGQLGTAVLDHEPASTKSRVIENFYAFFEKDMVYKGLKPVYWCIHDETALAEAEVEYDNHTSPSIWVRYRADQRPGGARRRRWPARRSRPSSGPPLPGRCPPRWRWPSIRAKSTSRSEPASGSTSSPDKLAEETARKCELGRRRAIIAASPAPSWSAQPSPIPSWSATSSGVLADYVTMDQGTGAVHTAPSHGADDFYTGVEYGIDQTCNVDESGRLRNGLPEYDGMTVFKANEPVIELLKKRGVLLHRENIEHSYPHCWRCHNPVIFRATEQWFISMEGRVNGASEPGTLRSGRAGRDQQSEVGPCLGRGAHLQHDRHPSRLVHLAPARVGRAHRRVLLQGCGEVLKSKAANRAVIDLFAREGADAWYRRKPEEILPAGTKCAKCGGTSFKQEMDIIDVWFESGSSQAAVLGHQPDLPWPADLYLEGGDQHRGWFHSSLLCAVGLHGHAPYRGVVTNGWTLDEQGRAMSKSLGNVVDPVDICKRLGAEVVRLWVASVDFREDVRASENLMQRVAENYRKIRNTFRYLLGNLDGFDPLRDLVPFDQMEPLDRFLLLRTAEFARELRQWYDEMQFHRIYQRLVQFSRGGPERALHGRAEGPAVHLPAQLAPAPLGAERHVAHRRSPGAAGSADHELYRRRSLALSAGPALASGERAHDALPQRSRRYRRDQGPRCGGGHACRLGGPAGDPRGSEQGHRAGAQRQAHQQRTGGRAGDHRAGRVFPAAGTQPRLPQGAVRGLFGRAAAGRGKRGDGRGSRIRRARGSASRCRPEVRTLLELFDPRRRRQELSHGLRTLLRQPEGDRKGKRPARGGRRGSGAVSTRLFHLHQFLIAALVVVLDRLSKWWIAT